jgi:multiple sugar transport system permease protein
VTAYRTLFYMPHFTAGVATYLLWKKMYNPQTGPINTALRPVLDATAEVTRAMPWLASTLGWVVMGLAGLLGVWVLGRLRRMWSDGELGGAAACLPVGLLTIPVVVATRWGFTAEAAWLLLAVVGAGAAWQAVRVFTRGRELESPRAMEGVGSAIVLGAGVMVAMFVAIGLSAVAWSLPGMAADGLAPPNWLTEYHWAKPSLMIMALWGAIGSNNMLLYLAALTNVPEALYEAADIDGASRLQRFWHVTWPQLAPTTFFIAVMSSIGGLQGGFEMARVMTEGGPAGATTTLSYFIYLEGFETGRLSFAAATAWVLFLIVLALTLMNWTFGNKYVND